jgi:hypothetical protein
MTSAGNQVSVLDPVGAAPTGSRYDDHRFRWLRQVWAWEDLNLRLHPYQLNAGNRCAHRPFRRSRLTVGAQGMRSNNPLVCVLRQGDLILTMEPPGTAVRTAVSQLAPDRRGQSYRFSSGEVMRSLSSQMLIIPGASHHPRRAHERGADCTDWLSAHVAVR